MIVRRSGRKYLSVGHPVGSHYGRAGDYSFGFYLSRKSEIVHRHSGEVEDCLQPSADRGCRDPFLSRSVSEFVLNKPRTEYTIYPDIIWNYEALKNNAQAEPVSVAVKVEMNGKDLGQRVRTFSVRSVNECLLGYVANGTKFYDTSIFFAAYVNEENPMIDQLLREALNTRIVNRFLGYQSTAKGAVDKQVYALWNILQKRKFATVPYPIRAFRAMSFSRNASAPLTMRWNRRRSTVWTAAYCSLRSFGLLISNRYWYVHRGICS